MGSILPQIQCHSKNEMTLYTQCNKSAITMKTCHLFANTLTAFAFTWQPAGAIQAQFAVALTLTPTPQTYAHATWGRLLPFFQLPGLVTVDRSAVSVTFRPFNDRQLNEDLTILCLQVSKAAPHLPDGRRLLFSVGNTRRPILDQYKRRVA
jgi:hypothetical protein